MNIAQNQCWEHIPEFVSKAGSQAIRIATIFDCYSERDISEQYLNNAFTITEWHLNQAGKYFYKLSAQYQLQQYVYLLFDWIKNHFTSPTGVMKMKNLQTGQPIDVKLPPWQPFSKNELETHGPARLRRIERLTPALNQLIQLGLIVTICYPPQRAIYIAAAQPDAYGHIYPLNPFFTPFNIVDYRNNATPPLSGYDSNKLQWQ